FASDPHSFWSRWQPSKSTHSIRTRAVNAAELMIAAAAEEDSAARDRARQFHLELRTLALTQDLRDNFAPRKLDLRARKRTVPPRVLLPNATEANGGLALLRAVSDIRSRRSELDPTLFVAAVPAGETVDLPPERAAGARHGRSRNWSGPESLY